MLPGYYQNLQPYFTIRAGVILQYNVRDKSSGYIGRAGTIEVKIAVATKSHLFIRIIDYRAVNCSPGVSVELDAVACYCTA